MKSKRKSTRERAVSDTEKSDTALFSRRNKQPPFKPTSNSHTFGNVFEEAPKLKGISLRRSEQLLGKNLIDAETGEPIKFSRSTWNAQEGRLDLRTDIIVAMGTGRLDIKCRRQSAAPGASDGASLDEDSETSNNLVSNSMCSRVTASSYRSEHRSPRRTIRHPIITQYLLEGPLNPRCHNRWDVRSDKIMVDNEMELLSLAEEDVNFEMSSHDENSISYHGSRRPAYTSNVSLSTPMLDASTEQEHNMEDSVASSPPPSIASQTALSMLSSSLSPLPRRVKSPNVQFEADQQIGQTLAMRNIRNWQAVEEKTFQELYAIGWQYEKNKSLTGEKRLEGGMREVRTICRELAKLKTKSLKEVAMAIADEKKKDAKRKEVERNNAEKPEHLRELMKKHNEERSKAKQYINALERDNEIIFIRKLNDTGYLW